MNVSRLKEKFSGFGFSTFERQAIWFVVIIVLVGASLRLYQNHRLSSRFNLWLENAPVVDTTAVASVNNAQLLETGYRIDINEADVPAFEILPGIGPKRAQEIVAYRDRHGKFKNIQELDNVPGIGPKTVVKIEPYLIIE